MWGLIARSERDRGLGIQSKGIYDHLKPDRTLVVLDQKSGFVSHPEDYPNATVVTLKHGALKNTLPETEVREWLSGLDVMLSVETLYDWDMISWAKDAGVRTVVQGNPEFWQATNPQPDVWIWPSTWRLNHLPAGLVVPVPVPERPFTALDPNEGMLRALHIAGNRAMGDRNGTDIVHDAMRRIPVGVKMTVYAQAPIPPIRNAIPRRPAEDRWDMYAGQHVLVLPRRYGGLCLPTLEAMASGCAIIMSDCPPNRDWPVMLIDGEPDRVLRMQTGDVQTFKAYGNVLANHLKTLSDHRGNLAAAMQRSRDWADANRWSTHAQTYYDVLDEVRSRS